MKLSMKGSRCSAIIWVEGLLRKESRIRCEFWHDHYYRGLNNYQEYCGEFLIVMMMV